jgi:preprotein translocase subunit YajC
MYMDAFDVVFIGEPLVLLALMPFLYLAINYFLLWPEEKRRAKRKAEKQALWAKMNDGVER